MALNHQLYAYSLRLLGRRWYSVAEMEKKLRQRQEKYKVGLAEDREKILEELKKLKYLDDRNFARMFIESALRRKPEGQKALRLRLRQKSIAPEIIDAELAAHNLDELELARLAAQKKIKTLGNVDPLKKKEKLYRFLNSRGFPGNIIMNLLQEFFPS